MIHTVAAAAIVLEVAASTVLGAGSSRASGDAASGAHLESRLRRAPPSISAWTNNKSHTVSRWGRRSLRRDSRQGRSSSLTATSSRFALMPTGRIVSGLC
jgi:hypothetical protein